MCLRTAAAVYTFDVLLFAGPNLEVADENLHELRLRKPPLIRGIFHCLRQRMARC
jgi:hypothetical protein